MISLLITDNASIRVQLRIDAMQIPEKRQKNPGIFTVVDIQGLNQEAVELGLNFKQTVYSIDDIVNVVQDLGLSLYGVDNTGSSDRIINLLPSEDLEISNNISGESSFPIENEAAVYGTINGGTAPYTPIVDEETLPPGTTVQIAEEGGQWFWYLDGHFSEVGNFNFDLQIQDSIDAVSNIVNVSVEVEDYVINISSGFGTVYLSHQETVSVTGGVVTGGNNSGGYTVQFTGGNPIPGGITFEVTESKGTFTVIITGATTEDLGFLPGLSIYVQDIDGNRSNTVTVDQFIVSQRFVSDNNNNAVLISTGTTQIAVIPINVSGKILETNCRIALINLRTLITETSLVRITLKHPSGIPAASWTIFGQTDLLGPGVECTFGDAALQTIQEDTTPYRGFYYVDLSTWDGLDIEGDWEIEIEKNVGGIGDDYFNHMDIAIIPIEP